MQRYIERVQRDEKREAHLLRHLPPTSAASSSTSDSKATAPSSFYRKASGKRGDAQPVQLLSMKGPMRVAKKTAPIGVLPEKLLTMQARVGPWSAPPPQAVSVDENPSKGQELDHHDMSSDGSRKSPPLQQQSKETPVKGIQPSIVEQDLSSSSAPLASGNQVRLEFRKFTKPANLRK